MSEFSSTETGPFRLTPLPWLRNALVPFLSEESITLHYDRKQAGYVKQINSLAKQYPELQGQTLADIVRRYTGIIRDIAAEILNHDFFWKCLASPAARPNYLSNSPPSISSLISPRGQAPTGRLYYMIINQYQSFENFRLQFNQRVIDHFGSGWVWLVYDPSSAFLMIMDGQNAYNPIMDGRIALLACDVWEHSYYLDYANNEEPKRNYINNFWQFVNWTFVEEVAAEQIFNYQLRTHV
jgi:Fe-Mn family superoxide dismutase